jgi:hypothetical protein
MYKIVGADQKEYGPVTEEQIRQWILEGRANAQTIARLEDGPWKPLSAFPEFASLLPSELPPLAQPPRPGTGPLAVPSAPAGPAVNGMAIAGLVCSIVGLFCCGPIFSTLGLIFSGLALSQISRNPTQYTGKGLAIGGIALALVGYILFVVLLLSGVLQRVLESIPRA